MTSAARIVELRKKYDENPRRYFAPLANEYRKAGDVEEAIALCRQHLPKQPGHMSGHIVYGQSLFEAGQLDGARSVFETALDLDPENLIALRHLGDIARSRGDALAARRWYERVLEADPRNDDIARQLATMAAARTTSRTPHVATPAIPAEPVSFAPPQTFESPESFDAPAPADDQAASPEHDEAPANALDEPFEPLDELLAAVPGEPEAASFNAPAAEPAESALLEPLDLPDLSAVDELELEVVELSETVEEPVAVPAASEPEVQLDELMSWQDESAEEVASTEETQPVDAAAQAPAVDAPADADESPTSADETETTAEMEAPAPVGSELELEPWEVPALQDTGSWRTSTILAQLNITPPEPSAIITPSSGGMPAVHADDAAPVEAEHDAAASSTIGSEPSTAAVGEAEAPVADADVPVVAAESSDSTSTASPTLDRNTPVSFEAMLASIEAFGMDEEPQVTQPEATEGQAASVADAADDAQASSESESEQDLAKGSAIVLPVEAFAAHEESARSAHEPAGLGFDTTELDAFIAERDARSEAHADEPPVGLDSADDSSDVAQQVAAASEADATQVPAFVTETMAELYLSQGLRHQALQVYRQLAGARPGDAALQHRLAEFEASVAMVTPSLGAPVVHASLPSAPAGPTARSRYAALARRRVGRDGEQQETQQAEPQTPLAPENASVSAAAVDADFLRMLSGSDDDERAAGRLAAVFSSADEAAPPLFDAASSSQAPRGGWSAPGGSSQAPGSATPASVTPTGTDFSFDRFFSSGAPTPSSDAPEPAATHSPANDIEAFNAWLQGLKQQ